MDHSRAPGGWPEAATLSPSLLAAIVDSSHDAIISKSTDGIILSWNDAAARMFGFPAADAIGRPITLIVPPDRLAEEAGIMLRIFAGERLTQFETTRLHRDGRILPVALTISPVKDAAGRIVAASTIARDLTPREAAERALRESEERFRTLADHMSQFAWMADRTGYLFWYNQRWYDYTGTTLDEMAGWGWTKVHHPDHVERVVTRIQRSWDTGEAWEDTFPLRGRDGTYRWFLSRAVPIRDEAGQIVRWFGTNTDITDQRVLEERLRTLSTELTILNQRKDEFLATLSHELRNPLSAIFNALALVRHARSAPEMAERALSTVERQVQQMVGLLEDLLDISRINRNQLQLRREPIDLAGVLTDCVDASRPRFDQARVTLAVTLPGDRLVVDGDATRLAQVFSNLLANAAKYTPAGGRASVLVEPSHDTVTVRVTDTGIGIPAHLLKDVFELFMQVDAGADGSLGGLGIGLSMVQRLVRLHGGTVTAHSDGRGCGSTFTVVLPRLATAD